MARGDIGLLYPGSSMLIKRLKHTLALSTVVLAVWMNDMQDIVIQKTLVLMEETQKFLPSAQSQVTTIETIIPVLKKLEDSRFGYLIEGSGLPTTIEMRRNCNAVRMVGKAIPNIMSTLKLTAQILRYTSILLCFQIAISIFWIGMDLKNGDRKITTASLVVLSLFINFYVHDLLHGMNLLT